MRRNLLCPEGHVELVVLSEQGKGKGRRDAWLGYFHRRRMSGGSSALPRLGMSLHGSHRGPPGERDNEAGAARSSRIVGTVHGGPLVVTPINQEVMAARVGTTRSRITAAPPGKQAMDDKHVMLLTDEQQKLYVDSIFAMAALDGFRITSTTGHGEDRPVGCDGQILRGDQLPPR